MKEQLTLLIREAEDLFRKKDQQLNVELNLDRQIAEIENKIIKLHEQKQKLLQKKNKASSEYRDSEDMAWKKLDEARLLYTKGIEGPSEARNRRWDEFYQKTFFNSNDY